MTSTAAERERLVAEAIHSGEMEGLHVSAASRADADEYVAGRIDSDELVLVLASGMDSTDFVDPHLDPETGVLRNKVGARTKVALDDAEAWQAAETARLSFPAPTSQVVPISPKASAASGRHRECRTSSTASSETDDSSSR